MNKKILFLSRKRTSKFSENIQKYSSNDIYYSSYDSLIFNIKKGKVEIYDTFNNIFLNQYHLVYFKDYSKETSACIVYLQNKNILFFNTDLAANYISDKLAQYVKLALGNYPVPQSFYGSHKSLADYSINAVFPIIMKSITASKGKNNYLVRNKEEFNDILLNSPTISFIIQEYIPNKFDYRILVLGGEIGTVLKRIRQNDNDHRNNTALGAVEEEVLNLDKDIINTSLNVSKFLKKDVAGVDIVINELTGQYYILEVNSKPLFTYDIKISSEVPAFTKFIDNCLS